jgi:hypothetical protein
MNTLQTVNEYMDEIKEKEMETFFVSKKNLQHDIFENEYLEKIMYDLFLDWLNTQDVKKIGKYWINSFVNYSSIKSVDKLPLCVKQEMLEIVKTTLFEKKVSDLFFSSFFHKKNVKRKSEKIKRVLNGENVKNYVWIEKEEEQKIMQCYYQIMMSAAEEWWNIPNKNRYKEVYKAYFILAESPYLSFKHMKNGLKKSNWSHIQDRERREEIKRIIKVWYDEKGKEIFPFLIKESDHFKTVNDYIYLLDESKRKELKKKYQKIWEQSFIKLKKSAKKNKLEELEKLQKEAEELEKW